MKAALYVWFSILFMSLGCAIDPQVSLAQGRSSDASGTLEVSGTTSFLERIAVHPDSYVVVTVLVPSPTPRVLATQRLSAVGNPPYRFALDVDAENWPTQADVRLSIQVYSPERQLLFHLPEAQPLKRGAAQNLQIRLVRAAADDRNPWLAAEARGVMFRAVGQEPGWLVEVDAAAQPNVRVLLDYGTQELFGRAMHRPSADSELAFTMAEGNGTLMVVDRLCTDTMSGEGYPTQVTLTVEGQTLQGCGRFLP